MKVVSPLEGKLNFSVPRDMKLKAIIITEPQTSCFTLSELWNASYLNEKNLIHGRLTAAILIFCPQIFETYFKCRQSMHINF